MGGQIVTLYRGLFNLSAALGARTNLKVGAPVRRESGGTSQVQSA